MTSIGSNVESSSGAGSSRGPPTYAWVSLTLEEQLTNFKRTICNQNSTIFFDGAFFESIARAMEELGIDPFIDIENLPIFKNIMHFEDIEHVGTAEHLLYGSTSLHWAVLMDDRTMVHYILTSGRVDINASTRYWRETALHYAIYGGNPGIVEDLLEYKADICICNSSGKSAIYYMVLQKDSMFDNLKKIIHNDVNICDGINNTPLHHATTGGDMDVVTYLLGEEANVNLRNQFGYTPLHYAVEEGFLDVVTCLLHRNVDIDVLNGNGWSPLHIAIEKGDMNIVSLLLEKNANINTLNDGGWNLLHIAIEKGDVNIMSLLLERNANINALNDNGWSLLHVAAKKGDIAIVSLLLDHNANVNTSTKDKLCPLHIAATNGHCGIVTHLLKCNANVDSLGEGNLSPLHFAAMKGYPDIVRCLVEHNAKINTLDKNGYSPLLLSIRNQMIDTSSELIAIGADVHVKDKRSNNALHLAIEAYNRNNQMMDIIELLQVHNVHANAKNSKGYSPFFIAVANGHTNVVKELLLSKEKIKLMEECNGQTAIQIAFDIGHEHIKRVLLECDDVSRYIGDLYRDRQVYVDAANAILVGAALIASVTFASWLQPPLGYTTSYLDLAPSSSIINYVDIQHNASLRAFWVFNTLSFYFAIGTVWCSKRIA